MARPVRALSTAAISCAALFTVMGMRDAAAQNAAAEALFIDGEKLMAAGKLAEACDAFEGSNRLEPRAGTLVNLGACREKNQQLASAWSAYKDAFARAVDPKKKQIAGDRIKVIEPKLSYLTISVPDDSRVDGLVVNRNGAALDPALWNRAVPVDGGTYMIGGLAPGHEEWSTKVEVPAESGKVSVEVPRFKELATLVTPPPPVVTTPPPVVAPPAAAPGMFTGTRKVALGVAGVGVLAFVGGAVFGTQASGFEDDAFALCPDPAMPCANARQAQAALDDGQSRALLANISYGVGVAAIAGAAVLWFTGGPAATREAAVAVTPRLGPTVAGLDLAVRF